MVYKLNVKVLGLLLFVNSSAKLRNIPYIESLNNILLLKMISNTVISISNVHLDINQKAIR